MKTFMNVIAKIGLLIIAALVLIILGVSWVFERLSAMLSKFSVLIMTLVSEDFTDKFYNQKEV